jgi:anti-anti-sigma regulatory factor
LKINIQRAGGALQISLRGDINESVKGELTELAQKIEGASVDFDVRAIELVNSLGARNWIQFMGHLSKSKGHMSFSTCSPAFVECCNIYPNFVPKDSVSSVLVPCECEHCRYEGSSKLEKENFLDSSISPLCPQCQKSTKIIVDLDEYLQFVRA